MYFAENTDCGLSPAAAWRGVSKMVSTRLLVLDESCVTRVQLRSERNLAPARVHTPGCRRVTTAVPDNPMVGVLAARLEQFEAPWVNGEKQPLADGTSGPVLRHHVAGDYVRF